MEVELTEVVQGLGILELLSAESTSRFRVQLLINVKSPHTDAVKVLESVARGMDSVRATATDNRSTILELRVQTWQSAESFFDPKENRFMHELAKAARLKLTGNTFREMVEALKLMEALP